MIVLGLLNGNWHHLFLGGRGPGFDPQLAMLKDYS